MKLKLDARALMARQRKLAGQVVVGDEFDRPPRLIAGVDTAFPEGGRITRAAAVLLSFPDLEPVDEVVFEQPTEIPYVPGLMSFRELPALLGAIRRLSQPPDVVLCDGQGRAHPRRFGIACHLGVTTGLATVGVGKSRLCGQHLDPGPARGESSALVDDDELIGQVVRTRSGVRPLFVSVGHRISLQYAVELVLACSPRYRLPEPVRRADRLAGQSSPRCSL